jgi:O26-antigen biosynthesis N-acetyl-L-fucosamine transferase
MTPPVKTTNATGTPRRILLVTDDYYPSTKSGAKMIRDLGREFMGQGHTVTVLTPSDRISSDMEVADENGLQIVRVKSANLKKVSKPLRAWRESRLSSSLWRGAGSFLRRNPHDLIIFYSPSIFLGGIVGKLKKLWHCPAYLVLRDIFPRWAVEAGVIGEGLVYRYLRRHELSQYSVADVIGVEAPGSLQYCANDSSLRNHCVEILYSWAEVYSLPMKKSRHRDLLGLNGRTVFFYGGNIGVAQDMDNIVRLAETLRHRNDIFFLLVGEGSEVPRLHSEIAARGLENINILPPVPQEDYLEMLAQFDIGLITLDSRLTSHNIPGKLFGYLNVSMPVLASLNPGNNLAELLHQAKAGLAIENGNDEALRDAALRLADDIDLRREMGANARQMLERKFSVRAAADQILAHFISARRERTG